MRFRIGLLGQTLTVTLCQLPRESLSNTGMRRLGCQQLLTHNLISVMHGATAFVIDLTTSDHKL